MTCTLAGLRDHATRLAAQSISQLIVDDPARARDFSMRVGPLYANFSRQRYDRDALAALSALAGQVGIPQAFDR